MLKSMLTLILGKFNFSENDDSVVLSAHIFEFINQYVGLCGLNVYSDNFKLSNGVLLFALFDLFTYIAINFYSMYMVWGDLLAVSFCLVTLGYGFQGCVKAYTYMNCAKDIRKLYHDAIELLADPENNVIKAVQLTNTQWCYILVKVISGICAASALFTLIQTAVQGILTNKRVLPFGFMLPWMDPYGDPGFIINWAHHVLQVYLTFAVCGGTLVANVNILIQAIGQINRLMLMLEHLDELCLSVVSSPADRKKHKEIKDFFGKIIKYYQFHYSFLNDFSSTFELHALINISSIVFQITLTMMAVVSNKTWFTGYVILAMAAMQLFLECIFGTVLDLKNDLLMKQIYNISWHNMVTSDQKSVVFLLATAQNPVKLSFKFGYLNLPFFVEVMKKVYTLFMMLQEFK